jgi:hypothetical protein
MIKKPFAIGIIPAVLMAVSCTSDQTPEPVAPCLADGQVVSYANDVVPILNTYCNDPSFGSCHQSISDPNASGFDFTTYDGFAAEAPDKIEEYVLGPNATMPKSTSQGPKELPDCEKLILQTWLDQGFPNN